MATAIKKCRVCGKSYEACRSARNAANVFHWQEVACSPECGSIYLARIEQSRKNDAINFNAENKHEEIDADIFIDDEDDNELDAELDEYFGDEE